MRDSNVPTGTGKKIKIRIADSDKEVRDRIREWDNEHDIFVNSLVYNCGEKQLGVILGSSYNAETGEFATKSSKNSRDSR